jgi:hypothetical protein
MGYTHNRKRYHLMFENADYAGLEVTMTGSNLGDVLNSTKIGVAMTEGDTLAKAMSDTSAPDRQLELLQKMSGMEEVVDSFYRAFASHLISWNVEEPPGTPVPPDFDGVKTQELSFINDIMTAWRTAVQGVDENLSPPSNNGGHALEASLPMEPSSPNLTNSTEPNSYSDAASDLGAFQASY